MKIKTAKNYIDLNESLRKELPLAMNEEAIIKLYETSFKAYAEQFINLAAEQSRIDVFNIDKEENLSYHIKVIANCRIETNKESILKIKKQIK